MSARWEVAGGAPRRARRRWTGFAEDLGLDGAAFRQAFERGEFEPSVLADERDAEALGIQGVPAFVADRRAMLSGVQPAENLRRLIARVRNQSTMA